jgi:hypothetical protein
MIFIATFSLLTTRGGPEFDQRRRSDLRFELGAHLGFRGVCSFMYLPAEAC